ncbi:TPA: VapC toxin family PIN domain ribonuclease [Candidatus Acetothermia bacterium]|nr:VapC toxin family PIN domain ribonuclease [Candidatus Acetothermia bacterium]
MKAKGFTLDTNIVTALIKKDEGILARIRKAREEDLHVTMNAITYYEIKRGLESIKKSEKIKEFGSISHDLGILFIDEKDILNYANTLWANLKQRGLLIEDADILIASIASIKGYTLVSDDTDFERVPELVVENWLRQ